MMVQKGDDSGGDIEALQGQILGHEPRLCSEVFQSQVFHCPLRQRRK